MVETRHDGSTLSGRLVSVTILMKTMTDCGTRTVVNCLTVLFRDFL